VNKMNGALAKIKSADKTIWMTKPKQNKEFTQMIADYTILLLIDTVLNDVDKKIASEIIMSAAEKLGSSVFDEYVKERIKTPKEWADAVNESVFNQMGTGIIFTKIADDRIEASVFKCPTIYRATSAPDITCPFSYGFGRGLWRKTFPEGEVIMGNTIAKGKETCVFTFLVKSKENIREKMKQMFENASVELKAEKTAAPAVAPAKVSDLTILCITESIFKHVDKKTASEIIINTAEKLGNRVFEEYVKEKPEKWTTMEWAEKTAGGIWNQQGTGVVFSEISDKKIMSHVFKCPTPERAGEAPHIACPFSWGYARGVWKKAFQEGEVLMGGTMAHGAPTCEFTWFVKAEKEHAEMREKVKKYLTKEEEMRML